MSLPLELNREAWPSPEQIDPDATAYISTVRQDSLASSLTGRTSAFDRKVMDEAWQIGYEAYADLYAKLPEAAQIHLPEYVSRNTNNSYLYFMAQEESGRSERQSGYHTYDFIVGRFGIISCSRPDLIDFHSEEMDAQIQNDILLQLLHDTAAYTRLANLLFGDRQHPIRNIAVASPETALEDIKAHPDFKPSWKPSAYPGGGWIDLVKHAGVTLEEASAPLGARAGRQAQSE